MSESTAGDHVSPTERVRVHLDGAALHLVFDNPARHNAMSVDMWDAVPPLLRQAGEDDRVRLVVFTGAGDTRPPLRFTILSQWVLMLPLAYGFTMFSALDFFGPWIAWAFSPCVQLLLTLAHFVRGRWKIPFGAAGSRDRAEPGPLNDA